MLELHNSSVEAEGIASELSHEGLASYDTQLANTLNEEGVIVFSLNTPGFGARMHDGLSSLFDYGRNTLRKVALPSVLVGGLVASACGGGNSSAETQVTTSSPTTIETSSTLTTTGTTTPTETATRTVIAPTETPKATATEAPISAFDKMPAEVQSLYTELVGLQEQKVYINNKTQQPYTEDEFKQFVIAPLEKIFLTDYGQKNVQMDKEFAAILQAAGQLTTQYNVSHDDRILKVGQDAYADMEKLYPDQYQAVLNRGQLFEPFILQGK